jgi:hypothetical protein
VLVPAQAGAGTESLGDLRLGPQRAESQHECAGGVDAAVGVGQREGLFFRHRVGIRDRVILYVAACRLPAQPFGDVARIGAGALGWFFWAGGPFRQRLIQTEPVPDHHVGSRRRGAEVGDEPAEELVQLVFVDCHDLPPVMVSGRAGSATAAPFAAPVCWFMTEALPGGCA